MIDIQYATESDQSSWMSLVRSLRENFPGLETDKGILEYEKTLLKNIKRQSAICAKDQTRVIGVLLFSTRYNMLCCMAVHPNYRRQSVATKMIAEMFTRLDKKRDIVVSTFRENDNKGIAPRALYKKFGFIEDELIEEFGYPNQRFVLRAE